MKNEPQKGSIFDVIFYLNTNWKLTVNKEGDVILKNEPQKGSIFMSETIVITADFTLFSLGIH